MSLLPELPHGATADEAVVGDGDELHRHRSAQHAMCRPCSANESLIPVIASQHQPAPRRGRVQSAIAALFRAQPDRVFTAVDLAQAIHGQATRTTCKTIRRAADGVAIELGWTRRKMWGRVDYVRPETISRITRLRAEKAVQLTELGYC